MSQIISSTLQCAAVMLKKMIDQAIQIVNRLMKKKRKQNKMLMPRLNN